jgi:hypothetical protein
MNNHFSNQVQLLVNILPIISKEICFALKGGTAINLFIRDLPRLSVDIDLAYIPIKDRNTSLKEIDTSLRKIAKSIEVTLPNSQVTMQFLPATKQVIKLNVKKESIQVKIEVTPVLRGSIHKVRQMNISKKCENLFGSVSMPLLSFEDLYGGKICATLDRQHPRDLFDIYYLLQNEGITKSLKDTFLIYLISHPKPISELLNPRFKDIKPVYNKEFIGMTSKPVPLDILEKTRIDLVEIIHKLLTKNDKEFLLSLKEGKARWDIFPFFDAQNLPAVKWKIYNISKMNQSKQKEAIIKLKKVFS